MTEAGMPSGLTNGQTTELINNIAGMAEIPAD